MMQSIGAAIASLIAEITVTAVQFYIVRNIFSITAIGRLSIKYLFSGLIMFVVTCLLSIYLKPSIIHTFITIAAGCLIYAGILLLTKDSMLYMFISKVKGKIHH